MIPTENTVLQEGDLVHVMATDGEIKNIEQALAKSPEEA
jgi:Trk K+ transport system NAD-binding subunit